MKCRIALIVEYDGHGLCGWQRQENGPTVQERLEEALERVEGEPVRTVACGRTDAGVHAEAQLVHADVDAKRAAHSPRAYTHGVNSHLPEGIRVVAVRNVHDDFHARFDCIERAYRYRIWNREIASALHAWRHWWMPLAVDVEAMRAAAVHLLGRHDFTTFRASGCQAGTPVREIRAIEVNAQGCIIDIEIRADAFLYHMVRNIMGALVWAGLGKYSSEDVAGLLELRDRSQMTAPMAPAHGLYFTDAIYREFSSRDLLANMQGKGP